MPVGCSELRRQIDSCRQGQRTAKPLLCATGCKRSNGPGVGASQRWRSLAGPVGWWTEGAAFQVLLEGGHIHAAALELGPLGLHPLVDGDRVSL
jgi:hypothetical protein